MHVRGLDWLNFFLADVQTGVGPFLAIYLAQNHRDPEHVGLALTAGGIAGIVAQAPAGWLVDRLRAKRGLIAVGVAALCAGSLMIALRPSVVSIMTAQVLIGGMSSIFNRPSPPSRSGWSGGSSSTGDRAATSPGTPPGTLPLRWQWE